MIPADYVPVMDRIIAMRADHPDWQLTTVLLVDTDDRVLVRAQLTDATGKVVATGHAEERRTGRAFTLEVCETSAVGRMLRFAGYTDKGVTEEELHRANEEPQPTSPPPPTQRTPPPADVSAIATLWRRMKDAGISADDALDWVNIHLDDGRAVMSSGELTSREVAQLIARLVREQANA